MAFIRDDDYKKRLELSKASCYIGFTVCVLWSVLGNHFDKFLYLFWIISIFTKLSPEESIFKMCFLLSTTIFPNLGNQIHKIND